MLVSFYCDILRLVNCRQSIGGGMSLSLVPVGLESRSGSFQSHLQLSSALEMLATIWAILVSWKHSTWLG